MRLGEHAGDARNGSGAVKREGVCDEMVSAVVLVFSFCRLWI